jgi:hypothetical protein
MNRGTLTFNTWELGPLTVCVELKPHKIFWEGLELQGWPDRAISIIAALIEHAMLDPDDLAALLGCELNTLTIRIHELRRSFKMARLPFSLETKINPDSKRAEYYRLVMEIPDKSPWLDNRKPTDLIKKPRHHSIKDPLRYLTKSD